MPTALPSPAKVGTAPRGSTTATEKLDTALKRARSALDHAKARSGAIMHTAICTAEIQAAAGVASFTSGYMNGKGKSLKVWGIDARLPVAIAGIGSGMAFDSVGTHGMALGNGVLASLVCEKAYDMGVASAKKATEGAEPPAEGVDEGDEDDEDDTLRRSGGGSDRRFQRIAAGDEAGLSPAQRKERRAARKRAKAAKLEREAAEYRSASRTGKPKAKRGKHLTRPSEPSEPSDPTFVVVDDSGEGFEDEEYLFDDGGSDLDSAVEELSDDELLAMQGAEEADTDEGLVEETPEE